MRHNINGKDLFNVNERILNSNRTFNTKSDNNTKNNKESN